MRSPELLKKHYSWVKLADYLTDKSIEFKIDKDFKTVSEINAVEALSKIGLYFEDILSLN